MECKTWSAVELSRKIKAGELTVMDAVEQIYQRIDENEQQLHCYISLESKEELMQQARKLQKEIEEGKYQDSPIAGVPAALKDNLCVQGKKMTCASKMLEDYVAPYTAEAVRRLEAAGVLFVGKTNMDEFSMGNTTESSYFGKTQNPRKPGHVPGGSSGGSAAAVAAGECFFSLGSETGGSVRQPGAYCGVVGLKPTYGTISRYGMVAYASSLDQIGPLTNTVEDCAAVLSVIAGKDEKDSTSVERKSYDFLSGLKNGIAGKKVALPTEYLADGVQPEIREALKKTERELEKQGAVVTEITMGMTEYLVPMYYSIVAAEASSNLARFDGIKYGYHTDSYDNLQEYVKKNRTEGFGAEVRKRIMLGNLMLYGENYEKYYEKALKARVLLKQKMNEIFSEFDYILAPVAPTTAPEIGAKKTQVQGYLEDIYTVPANLAGIPAITVPVGTDAKGLPIGIQFMADSCREAELFQVAYALEQAGKQEV